MQFERVYAEVGGRKLKMDIFQPDAERSLQAAVLLLHGGGWRVGDKSMMMPFGEELAKHGFVALAPEYRLLPEAAWPAQIQDVKTAVCWVRKNAEELQIDPDKIAVQGFSAGGHLALMVGGTGGIRELIGGAYDDVSDAVAAVVSFFPPIEFTTDKPADGVTPASVLLGDEATEEGARAASPLSYMDDKFPPTFLLHGTDDTMVPVCTSQRVFEKLNAMNVDVEIHLYPKHTHEFARLPSMLQTVQAEIVLFLQRTMVDPQKYEQENLELNTFAQKHG